MERMTKRQFWERAYFRACSLPASGCFSSDLASSTMSGNPLLVQQQKVDKSLAGFLEVVAEGVHLNARFETNIRGFVRLRRKIAIPLIRVIY